MADQIGEIGIIIFAQVAMGGDLNPHVFRYPSQHAFIVGFLKEVSLFMAQHGTQNAVIGLPRQRCSPFMNESHLLNKVRPVLGIQLSTAFQQCPGAIFLIVRVNRDINWRR
ncbi:MAG: hypothetical protein BWK76_10975 [Desulfobulbaceae bacterium A2]|nr:MAG: hypothetical protein BWK76_10975 [Desulfobulbaceae bacterium A2]